MKTHDGFYRQIDGLAMGLALQLHCLQMDGCLNSILASDDILRSIKRAEVKRKLQEINKYHPFLKFTIEEENENYALPFLDMLIYRIGTILHSTWYNKPTDTGLVMNYHALSPRSYKRSVVAGFVYRIHRACSSWKDFHLSLEKAKYVLEYSQHLPDCYEPIMKRLWL